MNFQIKYGNLGRDAEMRYTSSGFPVVTLSIAENYKVKGEKHTSWFYVTILGEAAESAKDLKKGQTLNIMGHANQRKFTDKQGNQREKLDLVVSEFFVVEKNRVTEQLDSTEVPESGLKL